jgi:hypothetical protein
MYFDLVYAAGFNRFGCAVWLFFGGEMKPFSLLVEGLSFLDKRDFFD